MQQWYFNCKGKLLGPLALKEAQELIAQYPDIYAWNPSYPQWMPVCQIPELVADKTPPPPPSEIPASVIETFITEEKAWLEGLSRIEGTLANSFTSLTELNIEQYIEKAQTLNNEVKNTVSKMEQQMAELEKSLAVVTQG